MVLTFVLSDTVPPTLPSHPAFVPELPPVPTHPRSICYPASHVLYPAGLSHGYCQRSYQSVLSFNLISPLWPFPLSPDVPNFVAQPWYSDSGSLRQRSDFLVTQPGNTWLILLLSSSGPQCAILWVSEGPLQVTQGSFL